MAKNKLKKFAQFDAMENTYDFNNHHKGNWAREVFKNSQRIVLELACGRGEYSNALGALYPQSNYLGIDIKGARLWKGASDALENGLTNVAFFRAQIDHLEQFFEAGEISELWITFPDPQPQISRERKRLTSPKFLDIYRKICKQDTLVNLKTDSTLLYDYTKQVIEEQGLEILEDNSDIYSKSEIKPELMFKTYYEKIWLKEGKKIKYLSFRLNKI